MCLRVCVSAHLPRANVCDYVRVCIDVHMCMCMVEVETVEALSVSVGIVGQRHGGSGCSGDSGASRGEGWRWWQQ